MRRAQYSVTEKRIDAMYSFALACGAGHIGISGDARVATPYGWRAMHSLDVGDGVFAQDGHLSTVRRIDMCEFSQDPSANGEGAPAVMLPQGAIGNAHDLVVASLQKFLLHLNFLGPFGEESGVLVPAGDLVGWNGIHEMEPQADLPLVEVRFGSARPILTGQGALMWCDGVDAVSPGTQPPGHEYRDLAPGEFKAMFKKSRAGQYLHRIRG